MSAWIALGAAATIALASAGRRGSRTPPSPATWDDLRELDGLLSYESPHHDRYRGFVYHGTTEARWQERRPERGTRLHLSASAEESREYALLASGSDSGDPPMVLRLPVRALLGYVLLTDLGHEEEWAEDALTLPQGETPTWRSSILDCGFFSIWGDIEALKPRFTRFRRTRTPSGWKLVEPPGRSPPIE